MGKVCLKSYWNKESAMFDYVIKAHLHTLSGTLLDNGSKGRLPCPDCSQAYLRSHQPIDSPSRWAEWQGESQIKDSEAGTPSPNPSQYCPRKASGWLFRCENHQGEAMLEHHLDWERWYHMELHYRIQGKRNLLLHNANYGMLWELWRRNQGWGKAGTKVA